FLMVFLIQNTQNRDARAIHLKLDELLRAVKGARTAMVALETSTDEELAELQEEFERLHRRLTVHGQHRHVKPAPETAPPDSGPHAARPAGLALGVLCHNRRQPEGEEPA